MVDPEILGSEYVVPKGGNQWGFKLLPGAPDEVRRKFAEFENAHKIVHKLAIGSELGE